MGGLGSGRPSWRRTVESCCWIDVNRLHREGCLTAGWAGAWQWTRDGQTVDGINLRAEESRLNLAYRLRIGGNDWEEVTETIRIVRAACRLGGSRPFFICPGVVNGCACERRVVRLYGVGRYFRCRHCHGLAYASQREGLADRTLRRSNNIRQRLGGGPGLMEPFPSRPKGMWQRTYDRLQERAAKAEMHAHGAFTERVQELLALLEKRNSRPTGAGAAAGGRDHPRRPERNPVRQPGP
jgi:hypothetical protein